MIILQTIVDKNTSDCLGSVLVHPLKYTLVSLIRTHAHTHASPHTHALVCLLFLSTDGDGSCANAAKPSVRSRLSRMICCCCFGSVLVMLFDRLSVISKGFLCCEAKAKVARIEGSKSYAADTPFPSSQDDEDVYILSKIADILHSFFGTHNEAFLPVFEKVMPFFVKMLVSCLFGAGSVKLLSVLTDCHLNHALLRGTGFFCPSCARYCHPCFVESYD